MWGSVAGDPHRATVKNAPHARERAETAPPRRSAAAATLALGRPVPPASLPGHPAAAPGRRGGGRSRREEEEEEGPQRGGGRASLRSVLPRVPSSGAWPTGRREEPQRGGGGGATARRRRSLREEEGEPV